ncbi:hypothetical protein [Herbidospora mongoliensis]|uniref:hypothetical protein n=1 Tax=Herbidospora mongoliensis TaxID=688067 RepID=UPI000832CCCB|nr:hypothetical protein [Herbidospora mongoliensis]
METRLLLKVSHQHRPFGVGEDRNSFSQNVDWPSWNQHQPSGTSEDDNAYPGGEYSSTTDGQHRLSEVGEDRNDTPVISRCRW